MVENPKCIECGKVKEGFELLLNCPYCFPCVNKKEEEAKRINKKETEK